MATDTYKTGQENTIDNNSRISEEFGSPNNVICFRFSIRGPANIRKQDEAYKVTVGKKTV
tara:strand:+ start:1036 stop:1215 length:180 start_codon:yes stop_codon:yes gene_type:complete